MHAERDRTVSARGVHVVTPLAYNSAIDVELMCERVRQASSLLASLDVAVLDSEGVRTVLRELRVERTHSARLEIELTARAAEPCDAGTGDDPLGCAGRSATTTATSTSRRPDAPHRVAGVPPPRESSRRPPGSHIKRSRRALAVSARGTVRAGVSAASCGSARRRAARWRRRRPGRHGPVSG